jgi:hypothetical protein
MNLENGPNGDYYSKKDDSTTMPTNFDFRIQIVVNGRAVKCAA